MQASARESYLATEVMTAAPQKLQLMLIDAAIRASERAKEAIRAEEIETANASLVKAQQIVGEMVAGLNPEIDKDLVGKVSSVYLFIFRTLTDASLSLDEEKLDDALRVLRIEQETWRKVCQELGTKKNPDETAAALSASEPAIAPPLPAVSTSTELPIGPVHMEDVGGGGFSIEA